MRVAFTSTFRDHCGLIYTGQNHQAAGAIDQGARPSQDTFPTSQCSRAPNKRKKDDESGDSLLFLAFTISPVPQSSPSIFFLALCRTAGLAHTRESALTDGVRFGNLENRRRGVASSCRSALVSVLAAPDCTLPGRAQATISAIVPPAHKWAAPNSLNCSGPHRTEKARCTLSHCPTEGGTGRGLSGPESSARAAGTARPAGAEVRRRCPSGLGLRRLPGAGESWAPAALASLAHMRSGGRCRGPCGPWIAAPPQARRW